MKNMKFWKKPNRNESLSKINQFQTIQNLNVE